MNIIQKTINPKNWTKTRTKKTGFVLHWIVGDLDDAERAFKNAARPVSAHFGIGDKGEIHQYVDTQYVAHHAGVWEANQAYIGIEHSGGNLLKDGTRRKPTHECHLASIELITKLCRDLGINKLERGKNIFKHSEIKATQCCGSLDIDYITNEVNKRLQPQPIQNQPWDGIEGFDQSPNAEYFRNIYRNNDWRQIFGDMIDREKEISHLKSQL